MARGRSGGIVLDVDGDIRRYEDALKKVPGVTEREAKKAAERFVRANRRGQLQAALQAEQAAEEAAQAWEESGSRASRAWAGVGTVLAANLSAAAIQGAVAGVANYADALYEARTEQINLAEATGLGLETFAGIERAAARARVPVDQVIGGFEDFGEVMFDAANGGGRAVEAFEILGVKVDDLNGNLRPTDDVLREVLNKLPRVANEAQRNAAAQQLFGDAGNRVNAILRDAPLDVYIEQARQLGTVIDEDAVEATRAWNEATSELSDTIRGIVSGGLDYLNVARGIELVTTGLVVTATAASGAFEKTADNIGQVVENARALLTLDFENANFDPLGVFRSLPDDIREVYGGAIEAGQELERTRKELGALGDQAGETGDDVADMAEIMRLTDEILESLEEREKEAARASKDRARAAEEQAKAREQELARQTQAVEHLGDVFREAGADQLSEYDRIAQAETDRLRRVAEIEQVLGASAATEAARLEIRSRAIRDFNAQFEQDTRETLQAINDLEDQLAEEQERRALEERERRRRGLDDWIDIATQFVGSAIDVFDELATRQLDAVTSSLRSSVAALDDLEARRDDLREKLTTELEEDERAEIEANLAHTERELKVMQDIEAAQRDSAQKAWKLSQGVALAEIGANTAGAILRAFAMFGPPPSPVGIASAGLAAATGAAQAALVATEQPQFHSGDSSGMSAGYTGGPDEMLSRRVIGEATLNKRAAQSVGRDAIDQWNATGVPPGGGGQAIHLIVGSRTIGVAVADELSAGRELTRALHKRARIRSGRRPVYGGR